jgi:O-antigen ligase
MKRNRPLKILCAILLTILVFIITTTAARLIMITFLPVFLYYFLFKTSRLFKLSTIVSIILIVGIVFFKIPILREFVFFEARTYLNAFREEAESQRIGSVRIRRELLSIGVEKFIESNGLGVGIGNFEGSHHPERMRKAAYDIHAHNLFIETLAEGGLISIIALMLIVFLILHPILFNDKRKSIWSVINPKKLFERERFVLLFLFYFIIATTVIGTARTTFLIWCLLGYCYSIIYMKDECNH